MPTLETDESLCSRIRRGDLAAFDSLYDRYQVPLFRYVLGFLGSREEAEDLFHEAFMEVLKAPELDSFKGWIYLVARNRCLNRLRDRKRQESMNAELSLVSEGIDPFEGAVASLSEKVTELPAHLREVLDLRMNGLRNDEIARTLDLPVGTVKSRFHTLVSFLRKKMEAEA